MSYEADLTSIKNASRLINEKLEGQGFFLSPNQHDKNNSNKENSTDNKCLKKLYFPSIDWKDITKTVNQLCNPDDISSPVRHLSGPTDVMYENDRKIINVIYSLMDSIDMHRDIKDAIAKDLQNQKLEKERSDRKVNELLKIIEDKDKEIHALQASNIKLQNEKHILTLKSKNWGQKLSKLERDFEDYKDISIRESKRDQLKIEDLSRRNDYLIRNGNRYNRQQPMDRYKNTTETNVNKRRRTVLSEKSTNLENIIPQQQKEGGKAFFAHLQDINSELTDEMTKTYCWVLNVYTLLKSWKDKLSSDDEDVEEMDQTLSKSKKNLLSILANDTTIQGNLSISSINPITKQRNNQPFVTVPKSLIPKSNSEILSMDSSLFDLNKLDERFVNVLSELSEQLFEISSSNSKIINNDLNNNNIINLGDKYNDADGDTFLVKSKKSVMKASQNKDEEIKALRFEKLELERNFSKLLKTVDELKKLRSQTEELK